MNKLIVHDSLAKTVRAHLFQDDGEHFAFFLCRLNEDYEGTTFSAEDVVLVDDRNVAMSGFSLEIQLPELIRIMNEANSSGVALVEAHNHPEGFRWFSYTDFHGFDEFVPYVLDTLRRPYGATVWENGNVIGLCWKNDASKPEKLEVHFPVQRKSSQKRK